MVDPIFLVETFVKPFKGFLNHFNPLWAFVNKRMGLKMLVLSYLFFFVIESK